MIVIAAGFLVVDEVERSYRTRSVLGDLEFG